MKRVIDLDAQASSNTTRRQRQFGIGSERGQSLLEGARVAVLPATTVDEVKDRVKDYLKDGQLGNWDSATIDVNQDVTINMGGTTTSGSLVTLDYPFSFIMLNPVAKLVVQNSTLGKDALTLTTSAEMRNEVGP